MNVPETPKAMEIVAEISVLKRRMVELRALLRFAETRELATKLHPDKRTRKRREHAVNA